MININPISVNKCFKGRRFKTDDYKAFREQFILLVKKGHKTEGWVTIRLSFHVKNYKMADVDNFIKPTLDAIVDCGFIEDDRFVKRLEVEKFPVKTKEEEGIFIEIIPAKDEGQITGGD